MRLKDPNENGPLDTSYKKYFLNTGYQGFGAQKKIYLFPFVLKEAII